MEFMVTGRHMEVPERLKAAAEEKVMRVVRHYDGWDEAEVRFLEERNPRITDKEVCEVTLRGHGHILRAKAAATDSFTAVDRVVDKLSHQVEKLKTRQSRKAPHKRQPVDSNGPVLDEEGEDEQGFGRIVKVKRFDLKPMTPEEAALQMEMLGHTFFFFTNADSGSAAVVYRRDDGYVGLIDASA
ncbi:MAG: ribosome-associated translation inhibitor RaiA [Actinomycetota bacterium]|jgi:putative sigma-54 modulation protein